MTPEQRAERIERFAVGPAILRAAWNEIPEDARHWSPQAGAWSAHQIIIHCADSETYAATRIRLLAAEPHPLIVGYDQDMWVTAFDYDEQSIDLAFAVITAVRGLTSKLLASLGDEAWARSGSHTESGSYSANDWLETYSAHLHDHAAQVRNNLFQWQHSTV